jgi:acetyltransferase-like isoleucine patch superfamily enzyme
MSQHHFTTKLRRRVVWSTARLRIGEGHFDALGAAATAQIGSCTLLNSGTTPIAERTSIRVGLDCMLGQGAQAFDSDSHRLNPNHRCSGRHAFAPVHFEEIVLERVRNGRNRVVAAAAVTLGAPTYSIAACVPACPCDSWDDTVRQIGPFGNIVTDCAFVHHIALPKTKAFQ